MHKLIMLGRLLETEVEDEEETEVLFTEAANASPFLSALTADDISCMASHRRSHESEEQGVVSFIVLGRSRTIRVAIH